jgi:2-dehydropantoate 2-reductase
VARVAVVGVGAVGTAMVAAVQQAGGHELVLCARRPVDGLSLQSSDGWTIDIVAPVVTEPDQLAPADWVLLAVKTYQARSTEGWLRRLCGAETTVVVLQNGIEQRESVRGLVSDGAVVPAVVWLNLDRVSGGRVRHIAGHNVLVPDEPRGRAFADLLAGTFVQAVATVDFRTEAWRKLAINAVTSLEALAGRDSGMFRIDEVRELGRQLAAECIAVARADGADLSDDGGSDVVARLVAMKDSRASILFDRLSDRPLEWNARNGVIRRLGARYGVPTPVSDVIVPLLIAASGERWVEVGPSPASTP